MSTEEAYWAGLDFCIFCNYDEHVTLVAR